MYAIIDVETGGFSKQKNGLCEVAVIIVSSNFLIAESYRIPDMINKYILLFSKLVISITLLSLFLIGIEWLIKNWNKTI